MTAFARVLALASSDHAAVDVLPVVVHTHRIPFVVSQQVDGGTKPEAAFPAMNPFGFPA